MLRSSCNLSSTFFTNWCCDPGLGFCCYTFTFCRLFANMPPKQKSTLDKLQQERSQLRRTFTKIFNEATPLLTKSPLTDDEIVLLKSSSELLNDTFTESRILERELRSLVLDEIQDETQRNAFFDESDTVILQDKGKLNKLSLFIEKLGKPTTSASSSSDYMLSRSKLPDLNLPTFDGNITEWFGFWERFQSQVGNSPDLPNSAKFTYLMGQLRGEALATVKGLIPSDKNYSILATTLQENFGLSRRIIRAHVLNLLKMPRPTLVASSLRHFYNSMMGDLRSLESLKIDIAACAPFIVPIMEDKLPGKVLSSIGDCGKQSTFSLNCFIEKFKGYIAREEQASSANWLTSPQASLEPYEPPSTFSTLSASVNVRCQLCKGTHSTQHCSQSAANKTAAVIGNKLCLNCLYPGHRASQCNAKGRCAKCKGKHHTAIHGIQIHNKPTSPQGYQNSARKPSPQMNTHLAVVSNEPLSPTSVPNSAPAAFTSLQHTTSNCAFAVQRHTLFDTDIHSNIDSLKPVSPDIISTATNHKDNDLLVDNHNDAVFENTTTSLNENNAMTSNVITTILLKTAKAVASSANKKLMARIFFDEGSQRSYVRTAFANELDLTPNTHEFLSVHGFGGKVTEHSYGVTDIGLETPSGIENVRVLITDEIVQPLQQYCFSDFSSHPRLRDLPLANDYKDNSFTVDILSGADAAYRFLGNVSQENSHPLIQESKFGYVLSGPLILNSKPTCESAPHGQDISSSTTSDYYDNDASISFENLMTNTTLFHQMDRLFQNQFVSQSPPSTEMSDFLHCYRQKIEFRNGSYYAPLPWKIDHPPLPSNLNLCKQRLVQVTSRLNKLGLMDAYRKVMAEHLSNGYIEEVPNLDQPWPEEGCHYLPHFFVLKDSETTPLRIVFAANTGHVSLNDCLYTGPCLLNNLVELLHRFRFPKYAFVADIQRAFLNIQLQETDRPFVRFLWYKDNDPSKEICVYTYNTIVFGHTSSPMTLAAVLLEHFQQYNDPVAVDLSHKLYVDNLLSGVQTEAEAIAYFKKAREIMHAGHFVLRQWSTNSPNLRDLINTHELQTKSDINPVLGLLWNSSTDCISFQSKCFNSSSDILHARIGLPEPDWFTRTAPSEY